MQRFCASVSDAVEYKVSIVKSIEINVLYSGSFLFEDLGASAYLGEYSGILKSAVSFLHCEGSWSCYVCPCAKGQTG